MLCYNITGQYVFCVSPLIEQYKLTSVLDKLAISTSTVCAVHCLALPIIIAVFPALGVTIFGDEKFHEILLWLVVPMTLISLTLGCKKHKDTITAVLGIAGLAVLIFTAIMGHDGLSELTERLLTVIGATIIAIAHLKNFSHCRKVHCDC